MAKQSAGILMYRFTNSELQVFLVHPGGPFWRNKDRRAWSIPKGERLPDEDPLEAAKREFEEETGLAVRGDFLYLGSTKQSSGKRIDVWAIEGDCDPAQIESNTFSMEWPPGSGKRQNFPEIDKAAWFGHETARDKLHAGQGVFVDMLLEKLGLGRQGSDHGR
jgi:predicted NUDIX family NTP pyrophosphohydrolase